MKIFTINCIMIILKMQKKNKNQISIVIEIFNIKKYNRIKNVIYNYSH